jgi:MFS family permease
MTFEPKDSLTEDEIRIGCAGSIKEGILYQTVFTLIGLTFLIDLALKLGASNLVIGLIPAIGGLTQVLLLLSVYLVEKTRNRRKVTFYAQILSRANLLALALIPFFFGDSRGLVVLIVALFFHDSFAAIARGGWNSWLSDLVPAEKMGWFYSKRIYLMTLVGTAVALAAGYYVDQWTRFYPDHALYAYSILFLLAFYCAVHQIRVIRSIPEPRMASPLTRFRFSQFVIEPFRDSNYRKVLAFIAAWYFAYFMAFPFFVVYMIRRLDLSLFTIIVFQTVGQILYLAFLETAGKFSDRFGNKPILRFCVPLFALALLAWTFTTFPEKHFLTLPLLGFIYVCIGVSTAGVGLNGWNMGIRLAPKDKITSYLGAHSLVNSIASGVAPIIGGLFSDFFMERQLTLNFHWTSPARELEIRTVSLETWDFFFILAFFVTLYAVKKLNQVSETGQASKKTVFSHFLRDLRQKIDRPISFFHRLGHWMGKTRLFRNRGKKTPDDSIQASMESEKFDIMDRAKPENGKHFLHEYPKKKF